MVAVSRYQVNLLHKLSKISKKDRQNHINSWPLEAFRDIKTLCKKICHNKKVTQKTIKKIRKQKKTSFELYLKPHQNKLRKY